MALPILDGNQSATTLSTILSSGQHITAHTVISLGTQAITDITSAVSGTSVCVGLISISGTPSVTGSVSVLNFPASQSTTFGAVTGSVSVLNFPASQSVTFTDASLTNTQLRASPVTVGGTVTANLPIGAFNVAGISADEFGEQPLYGVQLGYFSGVTDGYSLVNPTNPLPIAGTVTANPTGTQTIAGSVTLGAGTAQIGSVTASISNSVTIGSLPLIAGTVTANVTTKSFLDGLVAFAADQTPLLVELYNPIPAGTNLIGVVTIGAGTVTIGAGTAQIGSVTASISNSVTIASFATSVTARLINPAGTAVTYAEVGTAGSPSIDVLSVQGVTSGTAIPISISSVTIGSLPAISGTVTANTFALQGTAVTTSDFTSTTASTLLAGFNAGREVLTIFSEGPGTLFVCPGATCTTIAYQIRLSSGDYYEVPNHQTTITHSAVFATAGTARVTEVS